MRLGYVLSHWCPRCQGKRNEEEKEGEGKIKGNREIKKWRNGASIILSSALIWSPEEVTGVPVVEVLLKFSSLEEGVGEGPSDSH